MQLSASQLQSQHKTLIDALKRGEVVEITYHCQTLGIIHPVRPSLNTRGLENAMASFFGMHRDLNIDSVASVFWCRLKMVAQYNTYNIASYGQSLPARAIIISVRFNHEN